MCPVTRGELSGPLQQTLLPVGEFWQTQLTPPSPWLLILQLFWFGGRQLSLLCQMWSCRRSTQILL